MKWSYGVTTVPSRLYTTLPTTLHHLKKSGFDYPRLFVDGEEECHRFKSFGLPVTFRVPQIRTVGNWILSIWELYIREPEADRYALFQDDLVTYFGLRNFLEKTHYPEKAYLNLYTFPENQERCEDKHGWYQSNQLGRGAVALVFDRPALVELLKQDHFVWRPQDKKRRFRSIDGAIVTAMKNAGWREYIHNPSLVQHIGKHSSMGNKKQPEAPSFLGEDYNAMELIQK